MNKSLAIFTLYIILYIAYSIHPGIVRADWFLDRSGTLVQIDGSILGDEDSTNDDSSDELNQRTTEKRREELKKQTESRLKVQEKTSQRSKVEIRLEDGKSKLKQEIKDINGKVIQKREIEIKAGESLHVEQEDGETVQVDARPDGRLEMVKNKIKTKSELDLKVGEKNEISVTLPNGKVREVTLPDQALEKLVGSGVITAKGGEENAYELTAGQNGEPVYEVEGQVEKKLLGLFKLKFAQKMEVAASPSDDGTVAPGDIVSTENQEISPWRRLLYRLSSN